MALPTTGIFGIIAPPPKKKPQEEDTRDPHAPIQEEMSTPDIIGKSYMSGVARMPRYPAVALEMYAKTKSIPEVRQEAFERMRDRDLPTDPGPAPEVPEPTGLEKFSLDIQKFSEDTEQLWAQSVPNQYRRPVVSYDENGEAQFDWTTMRDPKWWTYNSVNFLPELVVTLGTGAGAGMMAARLGASANLAKITAAMLGGAVGGWMEGSQTYQDMLSKGATPEEAKKAALLMSMGSGLLNSVALGAWFSKLPKNMALKFVAHGGKAALEAVTEYLEEPVEMASQAAAGMVPTLEEVSQRLVTAINVMPPAFMMSLFIPNIQIPGPPGGARRPSLQSDQKLLDDAIMAPEEIEVTPESIVEKVFGESAAKQLEVEQLTQEEAAQDKEVALAEEKVPDQLTAEQAVEEFRSSRAWDDPDSEQKHEALRRRLLPAIKNRFEILKGYVGEGHADIEKRMPEDEGFAIHGFYDTETDEFFESDDVGGLDSTDLMTDDERQVWEGKYMTYNIGDKHDKQVADYKKSQAAVGKEYGHAAKILAALKPVGKPLPKKAAPEPLKDLPSKAAGPSEKIRALAEDYTKNAGIEYKPLTNYVKVDEKRAGRIAAEFESMEHKPNDPKVKKAYDALIKETLDQYTLLLEDGVVFEFMPEGKDMYDGKPSLSVKDITENNHMWIFPTDEAFGQEGADRSDHPLMQETNFKISGRTAKANDIFRAVHDYFGHAKEGVGFRADGEENAWRVHSTMYSPEARKALTTETRGQNSWVNFGPKGEANRTAKQGETVYADQKAGLLPDWIVNEGEPGPKKEDFKTMQEYAKAELASITENILKPKIKGLTPEKMAEGLGVDVTQLAEWRLKGTGPAYQNIDDKIVYDVAGTTGLPAEESMPYTAITEEKKAPPLHIVKQTPREKAIQLKQDDDLLTTIAKLDGLEQTESEAQGVDPADFNRRAVGLLPVFSKGGRSYDGMAEVLRERGFEVADPNELVELLDSALRGEKIYSTQASEKVLSELEGQRDYEDLSMHKTRRYKSRTVIIGAPDWVGSGKRGKIRKLREKFRGLAQEGAEFREWYEKTAKTIKSFYPGEKNAEMFATFLAIYSQRTGVAANVTKTIKAFEQVLSGATEVRASMKVTDNIANKYLKTGEVEDEAKIGSFYRDIMSELDPSMFSNKATIDMWMMFSADHNSLSPSPDQYDFMDREVKLLAEEFEWTVKQTQAAIWVATRARGESVRGALLDQTKGKLISESKKLKLWHKLAMEATGVDVTASGKDFGEYLKERTAQVSYEVAPGKTADMQGFHGASREQQQEYLRAVIKKLHGSSTWTSLMDKLGLPKGLTVLGYGAWAGEIVGGGVQSIFPVSHEGAGVMGTEAVKRIEAFSSLVGWIFRQDAVAYHKPTFETAKSKHNTYELRTKNHLTDTEMKTIYDATIKRFGTDVLAPAYTAAGDGGFRIQNFHTVKDLFGTESPFPNADFIEGMNEIVNSLPDDFGGGGLARATFNSQSNLIENDWSKGDESYREKFAEGRSDILDLAGEARALVEEINKEFKDKYGW